jgi:hypothetical protein
MVDFFLGKKNNCINEVLVLQNGWEFQVVHFKTIVETLPFFPHDK